MKQSDTHHWDMKRMTCKLCGAYHGEVGSATQFGRAVMPCQGSLENQMSDYKAGDRVMRAKDLGTVKELRDGIVVVCWDEGKAGPCFTEDIKKVSPTPTQKPLDGGMVKIDPEKITVGCVVRRYESNGNLSSFFDCIVIVLFEENYLAVRLARPYLYAHMDGWLQGVETFEVSWKDFLEKYEVVTLSTGEYHKFVL